MFILSWVFGFVRDSLLATFDSWFSFLPFSIWTAVWQGFCFMVYGDYNRQIVWFIICLLFACSGVLPALYLSLFKKDKNLDTADVLL